MALGYCRGCGELVEIRPGEKHDPRKSSRQWFPVPHPRIGASTKGEVLFDATAGEVCPGVTREL